MTTEHKALAARRGFVGRAVVGMLPAALLSVGVARYILHHFFVRAPYLLDSGANSAIVHHAGLVPQNAHIACDYAYSYYSIHVSPFVSLLSLLSYLSPLRRIEWYAFVGAAAFLPIGIATCALSLRVTPSQTRREWLLTLGAGLAFAFSGEVLWLIDYPHFEVAIPGFVCLTLGAVVTGRRRSGWLFLILAASVREDGGLHAALALTPVLYLAWRRIELRTSARTVAWMIAAAIAMSMIGMVVQKFCFDSANLLRIEYIGDPLYAHLSFSLLLERLRGFIATRQVIYYPLLATIALAVFRRDARYLFGWAVTVPWFLLNLVAAQDLKGMFALYTGFPFVVSMFWVYLYGATLAPAHRRLSHTRLAVVFALICSTSTLGFYRAAPVVLATTVREMASAPPMNREAVHAFVDAIATRRAKFGRLYVDSAVAALALESLDLQDLWHRGVADADAIAFHHDTWGQADVLLPDLIANHLDICTHIVATGLFVCSLHPLPPTAFEGLETEEMSALFVFARRSGCKPTASPEFAMRGRLGRLGAGTYTLTLTFEKGEQTATAELTVRAGPLVHTVATANLDAGVIAATFTASGEESLSFQLASRTAAAVDVRSARVTQTPATSQSSIRTPN